MSKGLKTTAALGTMMIGLLAMNAGAIAQSAGNGNASGQPIAEWNVGGAEGAATVTFRDPRRETEVYSGVTQQRSQTTTYSGEAHAKPKNGARSGN